MIEPVAGKPEDIVREFGCSRRLAMRVANLHARGLGVSALILEEAVADELLRSLLMEKSLLEVDTAGDEAARLLALDKYLPLGEDLCPVIDSSGGGCVLAAQEEVEYGGSDGGSTPPETTGALQKAGSDSSVAKAGENTTPFNLQEQGGASAFSPAELARLKVHIFAGATSQDKVSALQQFALSDEDASQKLGVFMKALADQDSQLRVAAISALRQSGFSREISDAMRLFAQGGGHGVAGVRLKELCAGADEVSCEAVMMLLAGCLRSAEGENVGDVLDTMAGVAGCIKWEEHSAAEFVGLLQEKFLEADEKYFEAFRQAFAAFDEIVHGGICGKLLDEIKNTKSVIYRSYLLNILTSLSISSADFPSVLEVAVEVICELPVDNNAARLIRNFITREPQAGLGALARRLGECDLSHQRSFVRFLDNSLHSYLLDTPTKDLIAGACLNLLKSAPLQLRADIVETHVLCRSDIAEDIREQAASLLIKNLRDYAQWPLSDYLENAFVALGLPAVDPLLQAVSENRNNPDSALLTKALGRIGVNCCGARADETADRILRELSRLSYSDNKIMDSLHVSIGMLAAKPGVSAQVNELVMRTLLARLEGQSTDSPLITALGHAACGNVSDLSVMGTIAGICRKYLEAEQVEPAVNVELLNGEEVYHMGQEVSVYSEMIPASIGALECIITSRCAPQKLRDELLAMLLSLWSDFRAIQVSWGLVNVGRLTESLGRIGASERITDRQRVEIAALLRKRANLLTVMDALSKIVSVVNRLPQFDRMAAALILSLIDKINSQSKLADDDYEAYLRILTQAARRGRLEPRGISTARLWERISVTLFDGLKAGVASAMSNINNLIECENIAQSVRDDIAQELKSYTSIIKK